MDKPLLLMGVYNEMEQDARVLRSAQALVSRFRVVVVARASTSDRHIGDLDVVKISTHRLNRTPFLRLLWFWVCFVAAALRRKPSIVYAHDFYMAFPGRLAAALRHAKFVYDAHELIITTKKNREGLRYRLFCLLEGFALPAADLVIAANRYRARLMKEYYGLRCLPVPIRNIPSVAQRQTSNEVAQRFSFLQGDGRRAIIYQGNLAISRGVHHFVSAMPLLRNDCIMVLVGHGTGLGAIRESIKAYGLERDVILLGSIPHSELHGILGLCHLGIVTYSSVGLNNIYCSPNKLFEYAYAGLPVITSGQRILRQVVEGYRIGECLSPRQMTQPETVARTMKSILQNLTYYRDNLPAFLSPCSWEKESTGLVSGILDVLHH